MATCLTRNRTLLRVPCCVGRGRFSRIYTSEISNETPLASRRRWRPTRKSLGLFAAACGSVLYFLDESVVKAVGIEIKLPSYPWSFNRCLLAHDHAALRRGWEVYRTICRTCHSLTYTHFLDFVNVTHTKAEARLIASEFEVDDGPDSEGNYFKRPCTLTDSIPNPFPNDEAAKAANGGAYPPDLSLIILARKNGLNYVFSLLTGWMDPPAGVQISDNQHFNVYSPGQVTSMADMLSDNMIEYEDGTPAYRSQMVKDVVEFLSWTASLEHDTRKIMFLRSIGVLLILLLTTVHVMRQKWSVMRSKQIAYVPKKKL